MKKLRFFTVRRHETDYYRLKTSPTRKVIIKYGVRMYKLF